jgi:hypothetical protein
MNSHSPHPLFTRISQVGFIRNWPEWRTLWCEARHVEMLHGLLHVGFQVAVNGRDEYFHRAALYLEVADGYSCIEFGDYYRPSGTGIDIHTPLGQGWPVNAFRAVATRAFIALCQNVFKFEKGIGEERIPGVSYNPEWAKYACEPGTLRRLLWFFRPGEHGCSKQGLENVDGYFDGMSGKHNIEIARRFAFDLARFILCCEGKNEDPDTRQVTRAMLDQHKPAAITLLHSLGRLDILLRPDYQALIDDACLRRLEDLAMAAQIGIESYRPVKTVEEAVAAGSPAARVLLILRTTRQEWKRLDEIRQAERELAEAKHEAAQAAERIRALQK